MKCIIHCYAPFGPVHYLGKHKQQLKRENLLWQSTNATTQALRKGQTVRSPVHFRPNANIGPSLILAESLPALAGRGDITVFLRTSTALFFVYWIANFVVPEILSKDFEKDSKELNPDDDNATDDEAGSTPISGKNSPESKQKGFQSTKRK